MDQCYSLWNSPEIVLIPHCVLSKVNLLLSLHQAMWVSLHLVLLCGAVPLHANPTQVIGSKCEPSLHNLLIPAMMENEMNKLQFQAQPRKGMEFNCKLSPVCWKCD